jgi:predicted MFS family arabinose efflux permease
VGTVIFAAGQALAFPALLTLAVRGTPAAERSSVVGTFTACADVGFALGALGLGAVAAVGGYESVFLVGALASVVGAFLLARTPARTELAAAEAS